MGQQANTRRERADEAKVFVRAIRISPRKLGLVARHIRGMQAAQAIAQLTFLNKRVAQDVKKALQSAVANAENNHSLDVDSLYVSEAYVGKSFVMKRFATRARGRSSRIVKPFSNLTIIVREAKE